MKFFTSEIQRAFQFLDRFAWNAVGVDHRRPDIGVAEQGLDRADIVVGLEKVRGEGMAEGVRGYPLGELSFPDGMIHRIPEARFMHVVPPFLPG